MILTTLWDTISQSQGEVREGQLKSNFLQPLVQEGAKFMRHNRTLDSAQRVLDHIVTLVPTTVRIAEEIRAEGKSLEEIASGSMHLGEVNLLIIKHREEIARFQAEMDAAKRLNDKLRRDLVVDKAEIDRGVAKWKENKATLTRGVETETKARQNLEKAVEEDRKLRAKLEQGMIAMETERKARQKSERAVEKQHSSSVKWAQDKVDGRKIHQMSEIAAQEQQSSLIQGSQSQAKERSGNQKHSWHRGGKAVAR